MSFYTSDNIRYERHVEYRLYRTRMNQNVLVFVHFTLLRFFQKLPVGISWLINSVTASTLEAVGRGLEF
jgi:hypothetical protein